MFLEMTELAPVLDEIPGHGKVQFLVVGVKAGKLDVLPERVGFFFKFDLIGIAKFSERPSRTIHMSRMSAVSLARRGASFCVTATS